MVLREPSEDLPRPVQLLAAWLRAQPSGHVTGWTNEDSAGGRRHGIVVPASSAREGPGPRERARRALRWPGSTAGSSRPEATPRACFLLRGAIKGAFGMDQSDVVVSTTSKEQAATSHKPPRTVRPSTPRCWPGGARNRPICRLLWDRARGLGARPARISESGGRRLGRGPRRRRRERARTFKRLEQRAHPSRPSYAGVPGLLANGFRRGRGPCPPPWSPARRQELGGGGIKMSRRSRSRSAVISSHLVLSMPLRRLGRPFAHLRTSTCSPSSRSWTGHHRQQRRSA